MKALVFVVIFTHREPISVMSLRMGIEMANSVLLNDAISNFTRRTHCRDYVLNYILLQFQHFKDFISQFTVCNILYI